MLCMPLDSPSCFVLTTTCFLSSGVIPPVCTCRRQVYETLTESGVEVPKYVVLNRPETGTGECFSLSAIAACGHALASFPGLALALFWAPAQLFVACSSRSRYGHC